MNANQLEGKWKQLKGTAKQKWGKLTNDDWDQIAGKREQLVGKLQERYGLAQEEAQKKCDDWIQGLNDSDFEVAREERPRKTA
jgi:uncharacterized protein YjbJ (UPF0337 family)